MFKINKFILFASILLLLIISFNVLAQDNEEAEERVFRNPFVEYAEPAPETANNSNSSSGNSENNTNNSTAAQRNEPVITFADIKSGIPFRLDGIITSGITRIAVVDTGDGVEFVRSSFEKNNYYISAINQDSIIVNNRGFTFQLRIGGEINER